MKTIYLYLLSGISFLFFSACNENKVKENKTALGKASEAPANTPSSNSQQSNIAQPAHLLSVPNDYELVARCDRTIGRLLSDNDSLLSPDGQAAKAYLSNAAEVGNIRLCLEKFAEKTASDAIRTDVMSELSAICKQDENFTSAKLITTNVTPCNPPVTGEQGTDSTQWGPSGATATIKTRYTLSILGLSVEDKSIVKKGIGEVVKGDSVEQRRFTPDLE